jgi:hypothetical protein
MIGLIEGIDDSETESQGDVGGIDVSDESEDEESMSEEACDDMPWVDVAIPMRPRCEDSAESALVPLSDIKPRPGRRSTQVGAQRCDGFTTALHYFEALFSQDICATFIAATNSYAAAMNRSQWKDVTVPEFKVFIALVLYFGIVSLPSRRMAWGMLPMYRIPWVASLMTLNRFEAILTAWHWTDATSLTDAERRSRNKGNPYWTVQGLIDGLGKTFLDHNTCPQCFDIDEQCIPWKGRHQAKCYNPSMPAKWHLKVYALNCAETCYQLKFFMYEGRSEVRPAGMPATVYPVWRLLRDGKYHHNEYILYLDNWYTSISVVRLVQMMGIHCVGTVRTNKSGLPKEAVFPKSGRGKRARGDMKCVVKSFGPNQDILHGMDGFQACPFVAHNQALQADCGAGPEGNLCQGARSSAKCHRGLQLRHARHRWH